jgi:hypothetical protein
MVQTVGTVEMVGLAVMLIPRVTLEVGIGVEEMVAELANQVVREVPLVLAPIMVLQEKPVEKEVMVLQMVVVIVAPEKLVRVHLVQVVQRGQEVAVAQIMARV